MKDSHQFIQQARAIFGAPRSDRPEPAVPCHCGGLRFWGDSLNRLNCFACYRPTVPAMVVSKWEIEEVDGELAWKRVRTQRDGMGPILVECEPWDSRANVHRPAPPKIWIGWGDTKKAFVMYRSRVYAMARTKGSPKPPAEIDAFTILGAAHWCYADRLPDEEPPKFKPVVGDRWQARQIPGTNSWEAWQPHDTVGGGGFLAYPSRPYPPSVVPPEIVARGGIGYVPGGG